MENVVNIFKAKTKESSEETSSFFEEIMKRNMENKRRLEEERKITNKNTIRNYRLKK